MSFLSAFRNAQTSGCADTSRGPSAPPRPAFHPTAASIRPSGRFSDPATSEAGEAWLACWRPAWELPVAALWLVSAAAAASAGLSGAVPPEWAGGAGAASAAGFALRMTGARRVLLGRARLAGRAPLWATGEDLVRKVRSMATGKRCGFGDAPETLAMRRLTAIAESVEGGARIPAPGGRFVAFEEREVENVWFGEGFEWTPLHAQRLYELSKIPVSRLAVPRIVRKWLTGDAGGDEAAPGLPAIHGVGDAEAGIEAPLRSLGGGTLIVGVTQCGKGVMLTNLVTQAILRGEVVIVIDPKSSDRLKAAVFAAAKRAGRPEPAAFHPAFPDRGVRLDPMGSFSRPTELASRVVAVMPEDGNGAFEAFAWSAVNVLITAMTSLEERPTLVSVSQSLTDPEPLLDRALCRSLERRFAAEPRLGDLAALLAAIDPRAVAGAGGQPGAGAPGTLKRLGLWERLMKADAARGRRRSDADAAIEALAASWRHNREHYAKITASLQPVLAMLTSGTLGLALSPDPADPEDRRPIVTLEKIVKGGGILYLGLDALPDATVARALGSILLADLAALAGKLYNTKAAGVDARPVQLFVDETANVVNIPLIELLNKGLEAGIRVTCAMQTVSDLAAVLGSEARARMALGNLNNLIVLRTKDQATQRFVAEAFGKTVVRDADASVSSGSGGTVLPVFHASVSRRLTGTRDDVVPIDMLGKLPNLEFFASLSGGRLYKGRVPILLPSAEGVRLFDERGLRLTNGRFVLRRFGARISEALGSLAGRIVGRVRSRHANATQSIAKGNEECEGREGGA